MMGSNQHPPDEGTSNAVDKNTRSSSIFMSKTASCAFMELQGSNGRKFHMSEGVMRNVLLPEHTIHNIHGVSETNNLLRRVHLQRVSIETGSSSTFPFALGIHISGIEGTEHTTSGERFNYIMPGRHEVNAAKIIHQSKGDEGLQAIWNETYAAYNTDNITVLGCMFVPDSDVVMVHLQHPIVQLLDKQYEQFGTVPPTSQPTTTLNWRQIQRSVFHAACSWLRENILSKSSKTVDLSQLTVSFSKTDKTNFNELPASCFSDMAFSGDEDIEQLNQKKSRFANVLMQKPFTLDIKISFDYRFSSSDNTAVADPGGGNGPM